VTSSPTTTPVDEPTRRNRLPLIILAVTVLIAVAAVVLVRFDVVGGEASAAGSTSTIDAELSRRMITTLEALPAGEHAGHGDAAEPGATPARTVCAVRIFGYQPTTAATVDEVKTVYAFHFCGVADKGRVWDWATKLVAPLVMKFDTRPPTIQMAESTAKITYRERVKQLFPDPYEKMAFEQALTPKQMSDLRRRYDEAAGL
jgi:hypothetical protein